MVLEELRPPEVGGVSTERDSPAVGLARSVRGGGRVVVEGGLGETRGLVADGLKQCGHKVSVVVVKCKQQLGCRKPLGWRCRR